MNEDVLRLARDPVLATDLTRALADEIYRLRSGLARVQADCAEMRAVVLLADDEAVSEQWQETARIALSTTAGADLIVYVEAMEELLAGEWVGYDHLEDCGRSPCACGYIAALSAVEAARKKAGR